MARSGIVDLSASLKVATMEVLYYLPDYPLLLQSFVWQTNDDAPRFPRLVHFLDYWRREIDATIHSVTVAHAGVVRDWRAVDAEFRLH